MRSRACLRPAAATAALAGLTGISLLASGCASRFPVPVPRAVITSPGHMRSAAMASQPTSPPAACSLLSAADVLGVARTFRGITITIDGHEQRSESPQISVCGFNQKGVHASGGGTMTDSGDRWAQLTILAGAASYDFSPAGYPAISGLGDGAYWDDGQHQVVIREGQDVLQVIDELPVNVDAHPNLTAAYRQAAQALAVKILSHWRG
jgi:hypothetical protein